MPHIVDDKEIERCRDAVHEARLAFEACKGAHDTKNYDAKFQAILDALKKYNELRSRILERLNLQIL